MKLQKLTIHNIASIEDAEIDFDKEPLAGSDVFLITGDTGSGKSTILDAICLALYADTPRLDNTKMQGGASDENGSTIDVDDPRQLLRRNTGEGFVELTFTTVKDNKDVHYKARWAVHRKDDNPAESFPKQRAKKNWTLTNIDTGVTAEGPTAVREIMADAVELTFDQFCRTTMLAQGEFTRFLNSNNEEKAAILEKITGTNIYKKIGAKIYEIKADKKTSAENAAKKVGDIKLLSDEEIAAKNAKIADCDARCKSLEEDRDEAAAKLQWITQEAKLKEAKAAAEQSLADANKVVESPEFKEKDLLVSQWNATIDARGWHTEQKKAEGEKAKLQVELDTLKANYLKILAGYAFEEQKQQQADEKLKELPQIDDNELGKAQEELSNLRKQQDETKELQRNIKTAEDRINDLAKEKQRMQQAAKKLEATQKNAEEKEKAAKELDQPIKEALQKKNDLKEAFDTQKEVNDVLLQLIRQKVHEGDICPVCHQPIKGPLPHEDDLAKLIEASDKAYRGAEEAYNKLVDERMQLLAEKNALDDSYTRDKSTFDKDTSVADALRRVTEACITCGIKAFDENTTPQQLKELKENADAKVEQLNEKITSANEKVNAYMETTEKRGKLAEKLAIINTTLKTVKAAVEDIQKDMPEWKDLKATVAAEVKILSTEATNVKTEVHTTVTQLGKASKDAGDNQVRLKEFLNEHPEFTTDRLVTLNAVKQADITVKTKEVNDARAAVSREEGALKTANNSYNEHLAAKLELKEDDTSDNLKAFVKGKDDEIGETNKEKGGIEQELKDNAEKVKEKGNFVKEKERLEAESNKWDRLNKFIGSSSGDAFNKIAQSYILGSLIHSANHYMHNLYDRYTLKVVPGTFVIMIEDAYQGYASRAASTISGGESFLVSLALALALSDIGDKLAVDTLFIDEGFGTLSGAPLQNAIDTLRKLHSQSGRHVGIISHIEELRESIPTQIQVIQSAQTGSSHIEIKPN